MKHAVEQIKLSNGAEGLVVRVPGVDVARILVEFHAGFSFADHSKYELPHVMEHMMFTNKTYPRPRQFLKQVEINGAFYNAYTNSSSLEYEYECANFEVERIANLITIQLTEPIFPAEELKTELGNVAEELRNDISNHGKVTFSNLRVAATGLPSSQQRLDQLPAITDQDLKDWYKKTHTAKNMRFIVAGDIDFDAKVLRHLDVELPTGKRLVQPKVLMQNLDKPVFETRDIPQVYYGITSSLHEKMNYRDVVAASIMTSLLSAGFSSNLLGKAREKGLIYGLGMGVLGDIYDTEWYLTGMVSPDNAERYFKLAVGEIRKIQQGKVSQSKFQSTKKLMRGSRARNYQKLSHLVSYYSNYFTVGYNDFDDYYEALDGISLEESVEAFNKLFSQSIKGISLVGNTDEASAESCQKLLSQLWSAN